MIKRLSNYDFNSLRQYDTNWAAQEQIPQTKVLSALACLLHYDGRVSDVIRFAGANYTAWWRGARERVARMSGLVDDDLLRRYLDLMTKGAPTKFNAESSRENAMLHWRNGNHPSIAPALCEVMKTMNKEERNNHVLALPGWIARFLPDVFFSPQHNLVKDGKKDRLIFDASLRYTPTSIPVNLMTSTKEGVELPCTFGDTFQKVLQRVWNLRITYPQQDIILHANDVKSCFRQIKHHPDVAGAFSYIISQFMFLQCGLAFGADFSPPVWEVCRRIVEQLAQKLFDDKSLVDKHWKHIRRLTWNSKLGKPTSFVQAMRCGRCKGVLDEAGQPENTPHHFFVDDGILAEVYDMERIYRAIAASIEAIFIILGESDLTKRQDPVSWDKLLEMHVSFANIILGHHVQTRWMVVETSHKYLTELNKLLTHWHSGRQSFTIAKIAPLIGKLNHMAQTNRWLNHLMGHLYMSLSRALAKNKRHLMDTNKSFRQLLKVIKREPVSFTDKLASSFAQSEAGRKLYSAKTKHTLLPTAKEELRLYV